MKKPSTLHCSAAEFISGNDDLLTLILLRLPLKSVAKFKSVSKQWLSLISTTPQFSLPKPLKELFSGIPSRDGAVVPLDGTSPPGRLQVYPSEEALYQHSCNGLYLSCKEYYVDCNKRVHQLYVSNPTTKLYAPLPHQYPHADFCLKAAYLAFDPYVSPHYKVVVFSSFRKPMIYSSETRHWRPSSAPLAFPDLQKYAHGVFWNGAVYWTSVDRKNTSLYSLKDKPQVYRFHVVGEERMERVALPSSDHVLYLGLSGERLHLVMGVCDDDFDVGGLNMYEMDKGTDRWCHVYCLRDLVGDFRARFGFDVKVVPTLCIMGAWLKALRRVPCCRVVFFGAEETCLYLVVGKILVRYHLKARTLAQIYQREYECRFTLFSQHMEIMYTAGLTLIVEEEVTKVYS